MMQNHKLETWLKSSVAAIALMGVAAPAMAQSADVEEVVVTGSRIARQDLVSTSPVTTVSVKTSRWSAPPTSRNTSTPCPS